MTYDDLLKRYQEAGAEFLDAARTRAEELFRELQRIGESTQERVEDLREGSRRNTDAVVDMIRRELSAQVGQLSTVTRTELARIFETFEAMAKSAAANAAGSNAPTARAGSDTATSPAKKAPATKKARATKKAAATKKATASATKKAPAKKAPGAAATATGAGTAKKAAGPRAAAKKAPAARKARATKKTIPPAG